MQFEVLWKALSFSLLVYKIRNLIDSKDFYLVSLFKFKREAPVTPHQVHCAEALFTSEQANCKWIRLPERTGPHEFGQSLWADSRMYMFRYQIKPSSAKAGNTPGVIRPLLGENTLRLIHKIEPVSILWMSRSVFLPSNRRKNARCDSAFRPASWCQFHPKTTCSAHSAFVLLTPKTLKTLGVSGPWVSAHSVYLGNHVVVHICYLHPSLLLTSGSATESIGIRIHSGPWLCATLVQGVREAGFGEKYTFHGSCCWGTDFGFKTVLQLLQHSSGTSSRSALLFICYGLFTLAVFFLQPARKSRLAWSGVLPQRTCTHKVNGICGRVCKCIHTCKKKKFAVSCSCEKNTHKCEYTISLIFERDSEQDGPEPLQQWRHVAYMTPQQGSAFKETDFWPKGR